MQGSAASVVPTVQVEAAQFEKVDRDRLVTLGGHMQHVYSEIVLSVNISAVIDEVLAHVRVALEGAEVEGREAIAVVFLVYPRSDLLLGELLRLCVDDQKLQGLVIVVESALVQQRLAVGVDDVAYEQV